MSQKLRLTGNQETAQLYIALFVGALCTPVQICLYILEVCHYYIFQTVSHFSSLCLKKLEIESLFREMKSI